MVVLSFKVRTKLREIQFLKKKIFLIKDIFVWLKQALFTHFKIVVKDSVANFKGKFKNTQILESFLHAD